ncbi:MAG TPA: hypothetical protein VJH65_01675 [Candidatus Nanoarchaeia archaeon]|nr:hypothetical protein [Candidatus Woesearchaeota archaeon]HLC86965.1 hypothetical protein [Candidatus Nanoarchaeia archaeon]
MAIVKTNITKLEVPRLDTRNKKIQVKIYTDTHSPFEKSLTLTNSETITKQILNETKENVKINTVPEEDSIFSRNVTVTIENDEKSEKKISFFISKLIEKTNKLKSTTEPYDYMKLYNEINDIHILKI